MQCPGGEPPCLQNVVANVSHKLFAISITKQLACWRRAQVKGMDEEVQGIGQMLRNAKAALKKSLRVDYYELLGVAQDATDADIKKVPAMRAIRRKPNQLYVLTLHGPSQCEPALPNAHEPVPGAVPSPCRLESPLTSRDSSIKPSSQPLQLGALFSKDALLCGHAPACYRSCGLKSLGTHCLARRTSAPRCASTRTRCRRKSARRPRRSSSWLARRSPSSPMRTSGASTTRVRVP